MLPAKSWVSIQSLKFRAGVEGRRFRVSGLNPKQCRAQGLRPPESIIEFTSSSRRFELFHVRGSGFGFRETEYVQSYVPCPRVSSPKPWTNCKSNNAAQKKPTCTGAFGTKRAWIRNWGIVSNRKVHCTSFPSSALFCHASLFGESVCPSIRWPNPEARRPHNTNKSENSKKLSEQKRKNTASACQCIGLSQFWVILKGVGWKTLILEHKSCPC